MITLSEDTSRLFNDVIQEISQNIRQMMEELWLNWSHLGFDEDTKINNITKLVQIEKELHRDVVSETIVKLKKMQAQVDAIKQERDELSKCLTRDITLLEFKEDMMLAEYKRELESQIAEYREIAEQRRRRMDRLMKWQRDLEENLGVSIQEMQEIPLPSEEELDQFETHLNDLQSERDKRADTYLKTQAKVKEIMGELHIKPQNKFEQSVYSNMSVHFKVTDLNMDRLAKFLQDLENQYEETHNRVLELWETLTKLWDCLDEDKTYRDNFQRAHPGCHLETEKALKEEIRRCEQRKRDKIQEIVANARTKIKLMWDNVMYSSQEREQFVHYYHDIFTEDTLTHHELYLEKITEFYNQHKPIFDLILTRKNLWLKMTDIEARASEPGRYHNRGGNLLKEEKERKSIASKLPKIEAQLRELVIQYEARTEKVFTVDGKPLLQLMEDEWETRKAERHNKLSARKQALTPQPLFRSMATSPLGKRNRTAAGLAATVDRNRPPVKRQLITGSATKAVASSSNIMSSFKRSAMTTVKRRRSGRLSARTDKGRRILDYDAEEVITPKSKTPKAPKANGSILKHKRMSNGRRRSVNDTRTATGSYEEEPSHKDPLVETTMLTTYTDFKDGINEKQISRSSMANPRPEMHNPQYQTSENVNRNEQKTPRKVPLTPKAGKENQRYLNLPSTSKTNLFVTPTRLTRSAHKLNDGFIPPRSPLSANKVNLQRSNTATPIKTTPNRSQLVLAKNLPPLI